MLYIYKYSVHILLMYSSDSYNYYIQMYCSTQLLCRHYKLYKYNYII